jgi:hypothetical protein
MVSLDQKVPVREQRPASMGLPPGPHGLRSLLPGPEHSTSRPTTEADGGGIGAIETCSSLLAAGRYNGFSELWPATASAAVPGIRGQARIGQNGSALPF